MRTMLKVVVPAEPGNKAVTENRMGEIIGAVAAQIKPEAAYFLPDGKRTAYFFFDLEKSSDIPGITEQLFLGLNAEITFTPVMNADELKQGLEAWAKSK